MMGKEICLLTNPGKHPGKEIIEISYGICLQGKEISMMGKEICLLTNPGKHPGKEITEISYGICLPGKEISIHGNHVTLIKYMADTDGEPNFCVVSRDCNKNQNKTTTLKNRILWKTQ